MKAKPFLFMALCALTILAGVIIRLGVFDDKDAATTSTSAFPLDRDGALVVGERLLVEKYGEKVLEEKPWDVVDKGESFVISGTQLGFVPGTKKRYDLGGVAHVEIRKSDGAMVRIWHTR